MDERPVTRYAKAPDGVSIAYQVTGDGPLDVVFAPGIPISIDLMWDDPGMVRVAKRLSSFSRTVIFDGRGWGSSEGTSVDVVEKMGDDDLVAVLDAVGCERVALIGSGGWGQNVIHFAVAHPERANALVLFNTFCHYLRHVDYPCGLPPDAVEPFLANAKASWGSASSRGLLAPSRTDDERFCQWLARCERLGAGPDEAAARILRMMTTDYRAHLGAIEVPTLVLHRRDNAYFRVAAGRYLGEHIPGAKYVELPGGDHYFFVGDVDAWLDEVEDFLTGRHQAPEGDVVTATILFTDIVSSTEQSACLGHRKWSALTDAHDAMVRATLQRHRGREIKTIGDAFLATFDATTRAVRAAVEIVTAADGMGLKVRAGVHTGEVEMRPDDVAGLAVTTSKRICDLAGPAEVLVSETVKGLIIGSGIPLSERGTHVLKGVPDKWRLFAIEA